MSAVFQITATRPSSKEKSITICWNFGPRFTQMGIKRELILKQAISNFNN